MDSERIKFEGRLAMLRREAKELEIQINGLVNALRNDIDPLQVIRKLPADRIASQALQLGSRHIEYMGKLEEIEKAKEVLGQ